MILRSLPAVAVALLPAACALPPPASVAATVPIPIEPHQQAVIGSIEGPLVKRNGCLMLRDQRIDRLRLLVWPPGSRFDGRVVVPAIPGERERSFVIGEHVRIEGTSNDWEYLAPSFPSLGQWRQRCGANPYFVSSIARSAR